MTLFSTFSRRAIAYTIPSTVCYFLRGMRAKQASREGAASTSAFARYVSMRPTSCQAGLLHRPAFRTCCLSPVTNNYFDDSILTQSFFQSLYCFQSAYLNALVVPVLVPSHHGQAHIVRGTEVLLQWSSHPAILQRVAWWSRQRSCRTRQGRKGLWAEAA
jgi:hypothetical protein